MNDYNSKIDKFMVLYASVLTAAVLLMVAALWLDTTSTREYISGKTPGGTFATTFVIAEGWTFEVYGPESSLLAFSEKFFTFDGTTDESASPELEAPKTSQFRLETVVPQGKWAVNDGDSVTINLESESSLFVRVQVKTSRGLEVLGIYLFLGAIAWLLLIAVGLVGAVCYYVPTDKDEHIA